jgi:transcriptional regulator with XRE-family HTH domain
VLLILYYIVFIVSQNKEFPLVATNHINAALGRRTSAGFCHLEPRMKASSVMLSLSARRMAAEVGAETAVRMPRHIEAANKLYASCIMYLIIDIIAFLHIMRNIMPARAPIVASTATDKLIELGKQIRAHRKALRISATTVAEAAGISRVTLHRIENGEPSVTMGAYLNAMEALSIDFGIIKSTELTAAALNVDRTGWIPARIRLADYPQLKQLAWQVHGTDELTPVEALGIYDRNWRHLDVNALEPHERQLVDALHIGLGERGGIV